MSEEEIKKHLNSDLFIDFFKVAGIKIEINEKGGGRIIGYEPRNGLDQFLTKNWRYCDLVKFIAGYGRFRNYGGEVGPIQFIIPEVLRMFGFPAGLFLIDPDPLGSGGREWSVGLPPYIVNKMKEQFPTANILFGPGYTFGLYSCGDGLVEERGIDCYHQPITDGIKKVSDWVMYREIYLMKRD